MLSISKVSKGDVYRQKIKRFSGKVGFCFFDHEQISWYGIESL
jgi:hypothetical protein